MNSAEEWFGGDEPRTREEARFLAALRSHQQVWRDAELSPRCTRTLARLLPLHVQIDLPAIPPEHLNLQVGYWSADGRRIGVEAEWGNGHLLDGHHAERLEIFGLPAEPEQLADMAARWLAVQLARSVDRSDWVASTGAVLASRWNLADQGEVVGQFGRLPWRIKRRPPDRVVRVR